MDITSLPRHHTLHRSAFASPNFSLFAQCLVMSLILVKLLKHALHNVAATSVSIAQFPSLFLSL